MDLSRIPAPLIARTLEIVGDSIENERVNERTGERGGHTYIVIDENENSIHANFIEDEGILPWISNQGVARFKAISEMVEIALNSKDLKRDQKIKMLEGYQKITQKYEHKRQGWFAWVFSYVFGQGKEVTKAEALIKEGLSKYRPADGEGKLEDNGCTYEGEFRNGFLINGVFTDAEGVVYKGHFKQIEGNQSVVELLDGEGSITYPSGISYVGTFVEGKLNGKGEVFSGEFRTFSGEFQNGEIVGPGKAYYPGGRVTESDYFIHGLTGDVKMTEPDESITVGYMRQGIFQGRVEVTDLKEEKVYVGELVDGVLQGSGRVTLADGTCYRGTFVDGKLSGEGMVERDGVVLYIGGLQNNEIYGKGSLFYPDKKRFEGFFQDSLNGLGKMIDHDENALEGELVNGIFKERKLTTGIEKSEGFEEIEDLSTPRGVADLYGDQEEFYTEMYQAPKKVWGNIPPPPSYIPEPPPNEGLILPLDFPKDPPPPIPSFPPPQ